AKARQFDVKDVVADPDSASNPADDAMVDVLEDHKDDPILEELTAFIDGLSEDERVDLVALTWLGRGDFTVDDWNRLHCRGREAADRSAPGSGCAPGRAATFAAAPLGTCSGCPFCLIISRTPCRILADLAATYLISDQVDG